MFNSCAIISVSLQQCIIAYLSDFQVFWRILPFEMLYLLYSKRRIRYSIFHVISVWIEIENEISAFARIRRSPFLGDTEFIGARDTRRFQCNYLHPYCMIQIAHSSDMVWLNQPFRWERNLCWYKIWFILWLWFIFSINHKPAHSDEEFADVSILFPVSSFVLLWRHSFSIYFV